MNAQLCWTVKVYRLKHGFRVVLQGVGGTATGNGADVRSAYRNAEAKLVYKPPFEVPA